MKKNGKLPVITGYNADGTPITREAMAPVIVSASRSTDIPAFYAAWLVERLHKGYCVWYNPFNRRPSHVSFEKTRVFVFWTKNPAPLMPYLEAFEKRNLGFYFQFTLNDYENEAFEPNVPPLKERLQTFRELSQRIGPDRVIWRFDPIVLGPRISPRDILMKIWTTGCALKGQTNKLVFSFVDVDAYRKVRNSMATTSHFTKDNVLSAEANESQIREICEGLVKIRDAWKADGWDIRMATCAETVDLSLYGMEHNRCIDDVLLARLYPDDRALMEYLGLDTALSQGSLLEPTLGTNPKLKDKGQRKACGCIVSKDIGMYDTCGHFCKYCYANTSVQAVKRNLSLHSPSCESIIVP